MSAKRERRAERRRELEARRAAQRSHVPPIRRHPKGWIELVDLSGSGWHSLAERSSASLRTISGGLPTLGKRRR